MVTQSEPYPARLDVGYRGRLDRLTTFLRQQKVGGLAALYLAIAYVAAMPYFLLFVKYQGVVDPVEKVTLLVNNQGSMRVMYLVS
jgi:hypothetical protein